MNSHQKALYSELFEQEKYRRTEFGNTIGSVDFFMSFSINKSARILDFGTNIGSFPAKLFEMGWKNVTGIDISDPSVDFGRNKYPFIAEKLVSYDGSILPFDSESFDVVTAFNVVEHLPQPAHVLREILRILASRGMLIFQTPNKRIDRLYSPLKTGSFSVWRQRHCSPQTPVSLTRLLEDSGFSNIIVEKFPLRSDYYYDRARRLVGPLGRLTVNIASSLPLWCFPNLAGKAVKPA